MNGEDLLTLFQNFTFKTPNAHLILVIVLTDQHQWIMWVTLLKGS